MPLSSQVECDQVDRRRLGVDFSLKSGHVSVPQRLAGLIPGGLVRLMASNMHKIHRSTTYTSSTARWLNQLDLRQVHRWKLYSPPGSPHPAHITSSQSSPSFSSSVTSSTFHSRLKLISFTILHSHSYSFRTDFTDLNLYCIKGPLTLFVLVSFSGYVC